MKRYLLVIGILLTAALSCRQPVTPDRDMLDSVMAIAADTAGVFRQIVDAGRIGARGNIAIIGEPGDGIQLARRFQNMDESDNIDGRPERDSLPDFAGEVFHVLLDEYNAPYSHFLSFEGDTLSRSGLDSLRELAVRNAVYAWQDKAKILIFTSPLQAEYGLFDVDTLQQLSGGKSLLVSPVKVMLEKAYAEGDRGIVVWTSAKTRDSGTWQAVFSQMGWKDATLSVISPDPALDIRTEFRSLLRQFRAEGGKMDVLLLDTYWANPASLSSEVDIIRQGGTEEDAFFDRMLTRNFHFMEPKSALLSATYDLLRGGSLFAHRISRPLIRYYETEESAQGVPVLVEADASYVESAYVQDFR